MCKMRCILYCSSANLNCLYRYQKQITYIDVLPFSQCQLQQHANNENIIVKFNKTKITNRAYNASQYKLFRSRMRPLLC